MGESEEHWFLKQVGWALLMRKGCSPVGTEVDLPTWEQPAQFELPMNEYHVADAAGLVWHTAKRDSKDKWSPPARMHTLFAIEAKVSRSDFQKGFCTRGWGKMWILTPPDLLQVEDLPAGVGHYEYDFETEKLKLKARATFSGFEISDTSSRRIRQSITWSGYGYSVRRKLDDDKKLYRIWAGGQQQRLPDEETPMEVKTA